MFGFIIICFLAVADRLTKIIALQTLQTVPTSVGIVSFQGVLNQNGPLGIPVPAMLLFIVAAIVGALFISLAISDKNLVSQFLFGAIALGIFSNVYDRFFYGAVIDTFRLIGGLSFNLADCFIVGAVVSLVVVNWRRSHNS